MSRQESKYLENKKSFWSETFEVFFIIFKGLSVGKNCLRPEIAPLKTLDDTYMVPKNEF